MQKKIKLGNMKVSDIRHLLVEDAATVKHTDSVEELLKKVVEEPRTRHVYVVDDAGKLLGSVRMNTIVQYLFPFASVVSHASTYPQNEFLAFRTQKVTDLMKPDPFYVKEDDTLSHMALILIQEKINELPVVDVDQKVIGQVNMYEAIRVYLTESL